MAGARPRIPVPVLMYHSLSERAARPFRRYAMPPRRFEEHLAYLRAAGYVGLTADRFGEALAGDASALPARPVVITFDDGYADFHAHALPALERHGFPATVFVTTGYVGGTSRWMRRDGEGDRPMMTWEQLADAAGRGIECGAHSHTHPELDTLPAAEAWEEIVRPKQLLEERLGRPVRTFAYPHGCHDATVRRLVLAAGYAAGYSSIHALSSTDDDRFALARIEVTADTSAERLADLLAGRGLVVAPRPERLRTRARRLARQGAARLRRASGRPVGRPA
jgi:peptidoglycan/xylan/chitin deacetylase (PgdA/CDA1 family)